MSRRLLLAFLACGVVWLCVMTPLSGQSAATGKPSTANGEWPHYTADIKGTKYSPLDQINAANFNQLQVAWRFKTDHFGPRPEYKLEGTPLMVKGSLYATAGVRRSVISLDARTGGIRGHATARGVNADRDRRARRLPQLPSDPDAVRFRVPQLVVVRPR